VRQKFSILGLLAFTLIGVAVYAYIDNQQTKINITKREQLGLHQAQELIALLQTLPKHRGASTALLSGNISMAEEQKTSKSRPTGKLQNSTAYVKTLMTRNCKNLGKHPKRLA